MSLYDYLPLKPFETRKDSYVKVLTDFFEQHPSKINEPLTALAKEIGLHDYRVVKKFLNKYKDNIEEYHEQILGNKLTSDKLSTTTDDGETSSSTSSNDYDGLPTEPKQIVSLQKYCEKHGIPYEYATSAKFINHNGQKAWNVVCDLSKISQVHLDNYFNRLLEELSKVVSPVTFEYKDIAGIEVAYHFYHSDKHVGAKTKEHSLFENDWSPEIFRNRLLKSLDDYILAGHMFGRLDKVLVSDLGDAVDGWNAKTTRGGHMLPQNLNNKETFDVYARVMCDFFDKLIELDLANEYEFLAMSNDNHGGDFSYIVNRTVEIYLNAKYPQVKTSVREKFIDNYSYGNHVFMLTHGKDDTDMKHGLPLNLDQKTELMINELIDEHDLHKKWIHLIKGDLHQESTNYGKKFRYRNVLSLYGSSAWSMVNHGKGMPGTSSEIVFKHEDKIIPMITKF